MKVIMTTRIMTMTTKMDGRINMATEQRTFLLRWNPDISNHKVRDFIDVYKYRHDSDFYFNWSVYDYQQARIGDRYIMVKSSMDGMNGIVLTGTFISEPFLDDDWSGKGREVYYMDMKVDNMADLRHGKLLASNWLLEKIVPEIDWNKGHSGELMTESQTQLVDMVLLHHRENSKINGFS